mmetsp:Transcript_26558/g.26978  ORF Transcript_26558/g.26978 Transcript_26558/m.26978 type:complete len:80 (+) Transcript_26558:405-644(+)
MNNNNESKDKEQLCVVAIDPNKHAAGSNKVNMSDPVLVPKLTSDSTENNEDMAGGNMANGDLISKNSTRKVAIPPKLTT